MKQPAWAAMTVLDVRRLEPWQATALAAAFESVATRALAPISQLNVDPVRIEIDEALCSVLGLPSLAPVRELLAREPGLTGRMIGARPVQGAPDLPEVEDDDQAEMGL